MQTVTLKVQGMVCEACAGHVRRALEALEGVQSADVDLKNQRAVIVADQSKVTGDQMIAAVEDEGYEAGLPAQV